MFVGGALVAGALAARCSPAAAARRCRRRRATAWACPSLGLTVVFLAGNLALQYGAARLPANRTAVVMLTEVVFAAAVGDRPRRRHAEPARSPSAAG